MESKGKIRATSVLVERNPDMADDGSDWARHATHWRVTLRYAGRRMTVHYSMGAAHSGEPQAADVLDCLCLDASGLDCASGFEDWAREYGFDPDSRKAERVYRACERTAKRLRRFLGADYDSFMSLDEGQRARYCA